MLVAARSAHWQVARAKLLSFWAMAPARVRPELAAVHALHLVELVARWRVPAGALLAPLRARRRARWRDPGARLSIASRRELVERARALTGEPALGFYLGLQMRISWHGYLGFAAMTAPTVREALELAVRFAPTRTGALALHLSVDGDAGVAGDRGARRSGAARDAIVFALIVGIWQIGSALTGRAARRQRRPRLRRAARTSRRFARLTAGALRFDQPENRLVFDAALARPAAGRCRPGGAAARARAVRARAGRARRRRPIRARVRRAGASRRRRLPHARRGRARCCTSRAHAQAPPGRAGDHLFATLDESAGAARCCCCAHRS